MPRRTAQTKPSLAETSDHGGAVLAASVPPPSTGLGSSGPIKGRPVWVKLADVHGTVDNSHILALIAKANPTEFGSVASLPYTYFLRYHSPHAAEPAIQSELEVFSEIIQIDPVALFPDWQNQTFAFPVEFSKPTVRNGRPQNVAGNKKTTSGCIRTPISAEKTQRQMASQPYPPTGPPDASTDIKTFEVYPVWKKACSKHEREAVQNQIQTLLVPLIRNEFIEHSLSRSNGVSIQPESGASCFPLHSRFHDKPIDAKHEDLYRLAVAPLAGVAQNIGAKPSLILSKQPGRKEKENGKGKGEEMRRRVETQAKYPGKPWIRVPWRMEDEPPESTRCTEDYDVPIPTDLQTLVNKISDWLDADKSVFRDRQTLETILNSIPTDEAGLKVLAQMRAGTGNPYQLVRELTKLSRRIGVNDSAVYYLLLRVTLGNLPSALERIGDMPGAQRTRIRLQLQKTHDRIGRRGSQTATNFTSRGVDTICLRDRSGLDMIDIIQVGFDHEDRRRPATILMDLAVDVSLFSGFGVVTFEDDGIWIWGDPDVVSHRLPKVLRIPVISMNEASPSVKRHAERAVIGTMHPYHFNVRPGGRLDYQVDEQLANDLAKEISDVLNPMEDVLWLGDAPGAKGRSLEESRTGLFVIDVMRTLLGNQHFNIVPIDWHGLDPFHPSNVVICTLPEITLVIDGIKPGHIFVVIIGVKVALWNTLTHLFGSTIKPEDVRFFEPYSVEYQQVQRIFIVIPHPGLHNYIAFTKWTREAFSQGLARICLVAATIKRLKSSVSDSKALVTQTLAALKSSAVNASLEITLSLYGIRAPWNGSTASKIGTLMDSKIFSFEQALSIVSSRGDRAVITNLTAPTRDHPRWDPPTLFPQTDSKFTYVGQMSIPVFCPASPKNGVLQASVKSILVDARWRKKRDDTEGHLFVDPSTMELRFEVIGGGILVNDDDEPFIIKRPIWMTSTSLGASEKILENLLKLSGSWKDLTPFEERELQARSEKGEYKIVTRSNLVHTFLAAEVEEGLKRGDITLIKIGGKAVDIRVWNQSTQAFTLLHKHFWDVPTGFFDNCDGATHFAVTYNFHLKRWEFLLYKICEQTGWKPTFVRRLDKEFPSSKPKNYFVKNGETTELFKIQRLQYASRLQPGGASA